MMPYYSEAVRREPNRRGKPRLVTVLGDLSGAIHHGFDGDGRAPKRGEEDGRVRLWEFAEVLDELPEGVTKLPPAAFTKAVSDRETAKPEPPPESEPRQPQLTDDEIKSLRALIAG